MTPLTRQVIDAALGTVHDQVRVERIDTLQLGPRTVLVALTIAPEPERSLADVQRELAEIGAVLQKADERIVHVLFRFG